MFVSNEVQLDYHLYISDMYSVILERNLSAVELGVSGPCLLRVQDSSLVLYSECGRSKLHHWAFENIKNISTSQDQIILEAYRYEYKIRSLIIAVESVDYYKIIKSSCLFVSCIH